MQLDPMIYLDTSFVIDAYERQGGQPLVSKITRTTSLSGGVTTGFLSGGAASQESKEFQITALAMLSKIRKHIEKFPEMSLEKDSIAQLPDCFWTHGSFSVGSVVKRGGDGVAIGDSHFLLRGVTDSDTKLFLLTSDVYFSAGYDQVLKHGHGVARGFAVEVRALVKVLSLRGGFGAPLCAPLLLEKTSDT